MDINEFEQCLDRFGSNMEVWPVDVGRRAEQLLASSEQAKHALSAAVRLDGLLSTPELVAPDALTTRILDSVSATPQQTSDAWRSLLEWLNASLWRGAITALVPLALGLIVGFSSTIDDEAGWGETDSYVYLSSYELSSSDLSSPDLSGNELPTQEVSDAE